MARLNGGSDATAEGALEHSKGGRIRAMGDRESGDELRWFLPNRKPASCSRFYSTPGLSPMTLGEVPLQAGCDGLCLQFQEMAHARGCSGQCALCEVFFVESEYGEPEIARGFEA